MEREKIWSILRESDAESASNHQRRKTLHRTLELTGLRGLETSVSFVSWVVGLKVHAH